MFIPILNIVLGVGLAIGGAMGELTLLGTSSSGALVAAGAVVAGIGVIQLVRAARRR